MLSPGRPDRPITTNRPGRRRTLKEAISSERLVKPGTFVMIGAMDQGHLGVLVHELDLNRQLLGVPEIV